MLAALANLWTVLQLSIIKLQWGFSETRIPINGLFFLANSNLKLKRFSDLDSGAGLLWMLEVLSLGFVSSLDIILFLRRVKNKPLSLDHPPRPNIKPCPRPHWAGWFRIVAPTSVAIYCDNQSALHIVANLVFHECIKYIEIGFGEKQGSQYVLIFISIFFKSFYSPSKLFCFNYS